MQSLTKTFPVGAALIVAMIGGAASLPGQVAPVPASPTRLHAAPAVPAPARDVAVTRRAVAQAAPPAAGPLKAASQAAVRSLLKFQTVRWGGQRVETLDEPSRILLAKAAADKAGLADVGLSYHDVYGVIEAETSWIQRTGASKDGTPNLGLAQFEPRTARGLGVQDPEDPVQAVFAAALYIKDGAKWAARKIGHLELSPAERAAKVREGVSVFYNLSVKGRNKWDGLNTAELPLETQRHIRNTVAGAAEAVQIASLLKA